MRSVLIPWETRLGFRGEAQVKGVLSYFSVPQKTEIDLGIDFYCELLENDSPSTPFYVQAKGTEHFDETWTGSIKKSTVRYWLEQPFPVFLVVYNEKEGVCYWTSIEDHRYELYKRLHQDNSETISFSLDRTNRLQKGKNKNQEFEKKVTQGYLSIQQFYGHPQPEGKGYVKRLPRPPRSEIELIRTKESIRMSMYTLILHYWLQIGDLKTAYLYCNFLTEFDQAHYNHFVWLGLINKELGDDDKARANLKKALTICEGDKKWPRESMEPIIDYIKGELSKIG